MYFIIRLYECQTNVPKIRKPLKKRQDLEVLAGSFGCSERGHLHRTLPLEAQPGVVEAGHGHGAVGLEPQLYRDGGQQEKKGGAGIGEDNLIEHIGRSVVLQGKSLEKTSLDQHLDQDQRVQK